MNWEPIEGYKMSNGDNKVSFTKNADGIWLISDQKKNKAQFVRSKKQARNIWKEYQSKGYKRY